MLYEEEDKDKVHDKVGDGATDGDKQAKEKQGDEAKQA